MRVDPSHYGNPESLRDLESTVRQPAENQQAVAIASIAHKVEHEVLPLRHPPMGIPMVGDSDTL